MVTTNLSRHLEGLAPLLIELTEWDEVGPARDPRLKRVSLAGHPEAQLLAESLQERLDIRETYEGLKIASTSFVGRVDVGPIRVAISPKLPAMPLAGLLRYAYGLRDIGVVWETHSPTSRNGIHDLLVALLAAEAEELLYRGLPRRYVPVTAELESPRGRILVDRIARRGGVSEARLPCRHFERRTNWDLNQVLRAGLDMAARLVEDRVLRRRVQQLSKMCVDVDPTMRLGRADIDRAESELTRLTAACGPALTTSAGSRI